MKKQILSVVAIFSLLVAFSAFGLARIVNTVKANIPFDFTVGGKTFQAGTYQVKKGATGETLLIRNVKGKDAASFIYLDGEKAKGETRAKLVFNRYGNEYFLSEIWDGSGEFSTQLMTSKAEREAKKRLSDSIANGVAAPEKVTVIAD